MRSLTHLGIAMHLIAALAITLNCRVADAATNTAFKKFKGPKPGQWQMTAQVTIPGNKQVISQNTSACIKPGEDLKQRALGQLGDASKGCIVSITQDSESVGALTTKCQNVTATVEMIRIKESEYRYKVKSSMANVDTVAKYIGSSCGTDKSVSTSKPSSCETCRHSYTYLKDQCGKLSDASRGSCMKSATKMNDQCTAQCKTVK